MDRTIQMHSEPDATYEDVGNAHFESGKLIHGDTDVARVIAAKLGILQGGRQRVHLLITATKVTFAGVDSDSTLGGVFAEPSEPTSNPPAGLASSVAVAPASSAKAA